MTQNDLQLFLYKSFAREGLEMVRELALWGEASLGVRVGWSEQDCSSPDCLTPGASRVAAIAACGLQFERPLHADARKSVRRPVKPRGRGEREKKKRASCQPLESCVPLGMSHKLKWVAAAVCVP